MVQKARNGDFSLQAALAQMMHDQAVFISHLDEDRQRFARIEKDLDLIKTMLLKHEEILRQLPEVIRDKIGFKPAL